MDLILNLLLPHVVLTRDYTQLQIHEFFYFETITHKQMFSHDIFDIYVINLGA